MAVTPDELTVVDDPAPRRIRSSLDGIRLAGLVGLLGVLFLLAGFATDTTRGANEDLKRGVAHLPGLLVHALSIVGTAAALAMPLVLVVRALLLEQQRRVVDALASGGLALVSVFLIDVGLDHAPDSSIYHAFAVVTDTGTTQLLDAYLAAWLAFSVGLGVASEPLWGPASAIAATLYALSTFIAAEASLLSILVSVIGGIAVGVAVRYVAGTANDRPDARAVAAALLTRGVSLTHIERADAAHQRHRRFRGVDEQRRSLDIDVLDRDEAGSGWMYRLYRSARVQPDVAGGPELSIERTAERRSLLALAAAGVQAHLPEFLGAVTCGPDAIVLAYLHLDATSLDDLDQPPSDRQVRAIWHSVEALHQARISHPALFSARIRVDGSGDIVLPVLENGTTLASDLRIDLDRAQLVTTLAKVIGAPAAVRTAREVLGDDALVATLPVLQPLALGRETRGWVKKHPALLDDIRTEIQGVTHAPPAQQFRLDRVRPRTLVTIVALIVAGWLLIGQLGSLDLVTVLRDADWRWVPLLVLASALTYLAATVSLIGYVREKLSFGLAVLAQLAASFTSFVTPPAVGGFAINVRFLQKSGVSTVAAATSIGVSQVVNAVLHFALLLGLAAAAGTAADDQLPIPSWAFIVLGGIVLVFLLTAAVPRPRRWLLGKVLPPIREGLPRLLGLVTSPVKLTEAIGGALLLSVCYIAALWCAMTSFHGSVNLVGVAVVYLAGGAIGSLAPTPGGLGAVEAALSTGLTAAGMPGAAAVSAVLLYRIATFWLPVPLGWGALNFLERRGAV